MLLALGAVSSALDALQSLTSSKSASPQSTGFSQSSTNPFDISGGAAASGSSTPSWSSGGSQISPATMSALLAAQSQSSAGSTTTAPASRSDALKDLFSQLDSNGDGQISKSEFENALGAGGTNIAQADDVFRKLDKNGNGTVSLDELSSALKGRGRHNHHAAGGSTGADGSTTTSVTYADGSKVTMTSPAAPTASSSTAASSYNIIERMIAREAQAIASSAPASLSVSV
jgi:hypothetical protein